MDEDKEYKDRRSRYRSHSRSKSQIKRENEPDEFVHPSRRGFVSEDTRDRHHRHSRDDRREHRQHEIKQEERRFDPQKRRKRSQSPGMRYQQIDRENYRESRSSSPVEKEIPNYEQSGALLGDKLYKGVTSLQYTEPPDSRKPDKGYRFYMFKGDDIADTYTLDQQPAYLFGRDRSVVDVPLDHPSCSKQHAVLQFRLVVEQDDDNLETTDRIAPFIYDLGSANGTNVNGERIKPREYVELKVKDTVMFGFSSREYLLLRDDDA
ncbi:SMAD/FHA domain-containing protein [Lipomyces arxii]|uniref:SMAD/FHA domain-containing protein n=1 Tax=Lipomyces arxii TaxID=56418 RepID=UPI0034CD472D